MFEQGGSFPMKKLFCAAAALLLLAVLLLRLCPRGRASWET